MTETYFYKSADKNAEKIIIFTKEHIEDCPDFYKQGLEGTFVSELPLKIALKPLKMALGVVYALERSQIRTFEETYEGKLIPFEGQEEICKHHNKDLHN